ncbi:hypothetical protein C3L33_07276, partial [Rhododendron williamsianum]
MTELCLSSTPKKTATQFSTLLLSDLVLFFSFILSHPLYFAYFIFFSPYLLKLLSFLSPLFITTALLLLGFLTLSPVEVSESQAGFLLSTYYTVRERLWSATENEDREFPLFEEFEAYKIIFDTPALCALENSDGVPELRTEENLEEKTVEIAWEEKRIEGFFKGLEEFENMTSNEDEKKVELLGIISDEVKKEVSFVRSESEATGDKLRDDTVKISTNSGGEYTADKLLESPSSQAFESGLGSYGSMRKEKEWKRTLACKLFEERHNMGGGEGMDSLWETYEMDSSNKAKPKGNNTKKNNNNNKKSVYVEEDYEEEDADGQLCCLQALKFSSGRMNFGMRKPSLVKISKAIKGIGWLHSVTRHGRKG